MLRKCGIPLLGAIFLVGHASAREMATTKVVRIERSNGDISGVVLAAGRMEGVALDAHVTLLREGSPIVHPLTLEPLGIPQEPVGEIMLYEVSEHQSKGLMVKTYSEPSAGDVAEYEKATNSKPDVEEKAAPRALVMVTERVEQLEKNLKRYGRSNRALQKLPSMSQQVLDEIGAMKAYLVGLDERLLEIEERQDKDQNRLESVVRGEYSSEDMKELTIRFAPDTDLLVSVAGKTLMLALERDSVFIQEPIEQLALDEDMLDEETDESGSILERLGTFMQTPYGIGAGIGLFIVIAGVVSWLIKRRYDDGMQGIDDWEDEYMDDDEEDDT